MALHPAHEQTSFQSPARLSSGGTFCSHCRPIAQADLELLNMERLLTFALTRSAAVWLLLCVVACGGGGSSNVKQSTSCPAFSPTPATAGSVASAVDAIAAAQMQALNLPSLSISIGKAGTVLTYSAGALWSNVDDLVTWNAALLSGKIIPPALFTTMVTPPASVPIFGQTSPSIYAMGWILQSADGHPYVSHDGQTGSYSAFNGLFLDDGFSVSIMTNVAISDSATIEQFAKTLIQSICTSASTAASC
jgi:CubicO group peptidase (beta-lactamase class C family)